MRGFLGGVIFSSSRLDLLPANPIVRSALAPILKFFSTIGLVPDDVAEAARLANIGGDGLSGLGKYNAITSVLRESDQPFPKGLVEKSE